MAAERDDIRYALAARAFRSGAVRLVDGDLSGATHLVATRCGLVAANRSASRLVAYGAYYGLAVRDDVVLAFESCDRTRSGSRRGRIVRFVRKGTRFVAADVIARGLDNGCHQIEIVGDQLYVADTHNQRILCYPLDGPFDGDDRGGKVVQPLAPASANDWDGGYAHVNSLLAHAGGILLMLHNGGDRTGRASEIARLDHDWRLVDRIAIDGLGCHNLAMRADGAILACDSLAGGLVASDGARSRVCDMMTRGLSVAVDGIAVGGSAFAQRHARDAEPGAVFFLDSGHRVLNRVAMPGPVTEIRRIDGRDRASSAQVARFAAR